MARKKIAVKKKVARKREAASPPSIGAAPGRAVMGRPAAVAHRAPGRPGVPKTPKLPGEGVSIGGIIMLVIALVIVFCVFYIFLPKDISHIQGYPFDAAKAPNPPRNLLREAEDQLVKNEGVLEFSEEELNIYLNQRLKSKQGGFFASFVSLRGAYVDYEPKKISVYIDRKVLGVPFIIGAHYEVYQSDQSFVTEGLYCTLGRLELRGGRMFRPVMMPYSRLTQACARELKLLTDEDVRMVKIEKDKVIIEF